MVESQDTIQERLASFEPKPAYFSWKSVQINRQNEPSRSAAQGEEARVAYLASLGKKASQTGRPCPNCGSPAKDLEWVYHYDPPPNRLCRVLDAIGTRLTSPGVPRWLAIGPMILLLPLFLFASGVGKKSRGWLTICRPCRLQIDFFPEGGR